MLIVQRGDYEFQWEKDNDDSRINSETQNGSPFLNHDVNNNDQRHRFDWISSSHSFSLPFPPPDPNVKESLTDILNHERLKETWLGLRERKVLTRKQQKIGRETIPCRENGEAVMIVIVITK